MADPRHGILGMDEDDEIAGAIGNEPPGLDGDQAVLLARLILDAGRVIDADAEAARAFLQQAAGLLAAQIEHLDADTPRGRLAPWQVKRAIRFIDENADRRFHVREIAAAVRLSPSYFSHAFKDSFGRAAKAYIIERRLERAKRLMIESSESLAQIAAACGFADQAHFSRTFNTWVGETPSRWRQSVRVPAAALAADAELDALSSRLRSTAKRLGAETYEPTVDDATLAERSLAPPGLLHPQTIAL
jgi:AraC family transcriptional regulator